MSKRKGVRLNADISEDEMKILKEFCEDYGRTQTNVVRDLVRSLEPKLKRNLKKAF